MYNNILTYHQQAVNVRLLGGEHEVVVGVTENPLKNVGEWMEEKERQSRRK